MFDRSKAAAGLVITGMSFALGLAITRNLMQAASTSAIALAASSAGAVAVDGRTQQQSERSPSLGFAPSSRPQIDDAQQQIAIFWDYENVRVPTQGTSAPLAELLVDYANL